MSTSFTRTSADVCAHLLLLKPPFSEHTFTRVVHDLTSNHTQFLRREEEEEEGDDEETEAAEEEEDDDEAS